MVSCLGPGNLIRVIRINVKRVCECHLSPVFLYPVMSFHSASWTAGAEEHNNRLVYMPASGAIGRASVQYVAETHRLLTGPAAIG